MLIEQVHFPSTTDISEKARLYAIESHNNANQKYGIYAYSVHLSMVVDVAKQFIHLIPKEKADVVIAGCWVHDVIEDTRQTYNDVYQELGKEVAELAYALTNEKGRNRKERANEQYYKGIRQTPFATFIKICDRIANVKFSIEQDSDMKYKYIAENKEFIKELQGKSYDEMEVGWNVEMFSHLTELLLCRETVNTKTNQ
jgi:(p)ppGpp synthase/HD superfamily hydrolase